MQDPTSKIQAGTFRYIAPLGTADLPEKIYGRGKRPWDYGVTVAIPHLDTLEPLKVAIALLKLQTVEPFIMVVDTGSPPAVRAQLEAMREEGLEIHYVAGHAYRHTSEPVTVALDLAQTLCRTKHLFHTHADVFLKRRDFLEYLLRITSVNTPAVGYRMSPRDWATDEWEEMVGHTALMLYMPSIHRAGATWSFQRVHYGYGYTWRHDSGWPDTETGFNRALFAAGIAPLFIGHDVNDAQEDSNFVHVRSYPGSRIYMQGSTQHVAREDSMVKALREAWARIDEWQSCVAEGSRQA